MMIKIASRFTNTTVFYQIYKLLRNKELLINLGSLGVLFIKKDYLIEVSIVALGEDVSNDFFLTSHTQEPPKEKKPLNSGVKEAGERSLFDNL